MKWYQLNLLISEKPKKEKWHCWDSSCPFNKRLFSHFLHCSYTAKGFSCKGTEAVRPDTPSLDTRTHVDKDTYADNLVNASALEATQSCGYYTTIYFNRSKDFKTHTHIYAQTYIQTHTLLPNTHTCFSSWGWASSSGMKSRQMWMEGIPATVSGRSAWG